jgi:hypothetical protein
MCLELVMSSCLCANTGPLWNGFESLQEIEVSPDLTRLWRRLPSAAGGDAEPDVCSDTDGAFWNLDNGMGDIPAGGVRWSRQPYRKLWFTVLDKP